jgi:hypothetical protein
MMPSSVAESYKVSLTDAATSVYDTQLKKEYPIMAPMNPVFDGPISLNVSD